MKATEPNYDPGAYWISQEQPEEAAKWRNAFAAFLQGMTLKEIAESIGVNYNTLRTRACESNDDWPSARQKLVLSRVEHHLTLNNKIEMSLERIKANREKNLEGAVKLRDVLMDVVDQLQAGTLRVQKAFNTKMGIHIEEMLPSTGDLVNIATFARTIADLTYRALGDAPADSKQTAANATAGNTSAPPGITVILPAVAVHPRPRRQQTKRAVVTDVASTVEQSNERPADSGEIHEPLPPSAPTQEAEHVDP